MLLLRIKALIVNSIKAFLLPLRAIQLSHVRIVVAPQLVFFYFVQFKFIHIKQKAKIALFRTVIIVISILRLI